MHIYAELAKSAVENFVKNGICPPLPKALPPEALEQQAGVFVTLRSHGELRGCIGTIFAACDNIADEIMTNAIYACSEDNRFLPVREDEFSDLSYEVSILEKPQPIDGLEGHDPKKFGLIVRAGNRQSGLLLPDLEGVDTAEQQFEICCQKGGIDPKDKDISLFAFDVKKYI